MENNEPIEITLTRANEWDEAMRVLYGYSMTPIECSAPPTPTINNVKVFYES